VNAKQVFFRFKIGLGVTNFKSLGKDASKNH